VGTPRCRFTYDSEPTPLAKEIHEATPPGFFPCPGEDRCRRSHWQSPLRRNAEAWPLARSPYGNMLRVSPKARRNRVAGPRRGVKRRARSLDRSPHRSPTTPPPQAPKLDARWSVSGASPSRDREGLNPRFRHLPRIETGVQFGTGSGSTDRRGDVSESSLQRRLFFNATTARKSLTLFSFQKGVTGGQLSSRTSVEITFPYLAQRCELCEAYLSTAAMCCLHLAKAHGLARSTLLCSICGISKRRRHEIECHAAVCRNATKAVVVGVRCTLCDKSFKSKRGVSIHARSAHTAAYVAQRSANSGGKKAPGKKFRNSV
jgi:hypothetical protein